MDHYVGMLAAGLGHAGPFEPSVVRPGFRERFARLSWLVGRRHGRTLDRYINRYIDYPRAAARASGFDLYHVVDQTYAHAIHSLPPGRTVLTCHDLDFASPPPGTRRAWLVRTTGAASLRGLVSAARVICDSHAIGHELLRRGLVQPDRLVVVPLGVEDDFSPDGPAALSPEAEALLKSPGVGPIVLHVGAMVPRKRIDLVLHSFAAIRRSLPNAMLVRAGGALSPVMRELADRLEIGRAFVSMPFLSRPELAALYRRADIFLLCSESEGFGLPVLEAMASGLPVISRELAAVREVAGDAIRYVPGTDPDAYATAAVAVLRDAELRRSMRQQGLERADRFRWARTAELTQRVYEELLAVRTVPGPSKPAG